MSNVIVTVSNSIVTHIVIIKFRELTYQTAKTTSA